jgi:predicted Zn-dependent protease
LLALGRNLYGRGLDRQDEFEADRLGVELASRAGFDPYGLVAALQHLRTATPEDPVFALTFSTHPPADARLDLLAQSMERRLDGLSGQASVPVAQRVARFGQMANPTNPARTANPRASNTRPGQPAPKVNSTAGKP